MHRCKLSAISCVCNICTLSLLGLLWLWPWGVQAQETVPAPPPGLGALQPQPVGVVPVSFSLLPFLSFNRNVQGFPLNHFSINATAEVAGPLSGMEISGLGSYRDGDVSGLQISGLCNFNRGRLGGLQVAGLSNVVLGRAAGMQVGGLYNLSVGPWRGLQVSGLLNQAWSSMDGLQIGGLMNHVAGNARGLQVAGVMNHVHGEFRGLQLGGVLNFAGGVRGMQLGLINVSRGEVKGFQLGLVNVAPASAFSLGLVNVVPGGRNGLALVLNSTGSVDLESKNGGKYWHTLISLGQERREGFGEGGRTLLGLGFGVHFPGSGQVVWNIDAYHRQKYFHEDTFMGSTLRLALDLPLAPHLFLSLGGGLTVFVYDGNLDGPDSLFGGWMPRDGHDRATRHEVRIIPEFSLGLSCLF